MRLEKNNFKKEERKLKKHLKERENYEKILKHIKSCVDFSELSNHPISYMYGFEQLKYFKEEYYSFNLNKSSGMIRLILKIDKIENVAILLYISLKHYEDFKRRVYSNGKIEI